MASSPVIPSRLDHLIYAVPDLDRGIDDVERLLGVRPMAGGRHEAFGTCNALIALGEEHYLELLAPDRSAAPPDGPRILGLDDVHEPALMAWIARADGIDGFAARVRSRGAALGDVLAGGRTKPDGSRVTWKCTDPAAVQVPGILPFFIDWGNTPSPAHSAPRGCSLVSFQAQHPQPVSMRAALERLELDLVVEEGTRPAFTAVIECPNGRVTLS